MTFPSLPTDSLYKFLAIGGILLIAVANYVSFQTTASMQDVRYKENQAHLARQLERINNAVDGVRKDHEEKAERTRELKVALDSITQYGQMEMKDVQARIKEMETESKALISKMGWLNLLGFGIAGLGFVAWWFRIQRHQDETIRIERDKAKLELDKLRQGK